MINAAMHIIIYYWKKMPTHLVASQNMSQNLERFCNVHIVTSHNFFACAYPNIEYF